VLEALLASELLGAWLIHTIEAAVVRAGTAPDPDATAIAQQRELAAAWLPGPEADWSAWCGERGIHPGCLEPALQRRQALAAWKLQSFGTAARELYLERGPALDQLRFSLLQTDDPHLCQEWYFKLLDGDRELADLAPQSLGNERHTGGRIGPIRLRAIQSPLDRLLTRATPGRIQPPLRLPSGRTILVRLEQRQPAQWDDATRQELVEELHRAWLGRVLDQLRAQQPLPGAPCPLPLP